MRAKSLITSLCLLLCAVQFGVAQEKPAAETAEQRSERFAALKAAAETDGENAVQALRDFESAGDFTLDDAAKELRDKLATRVVDATIGPNVSPEESAAAGVALHDAGYTDLARALLVAAWKGLQASSKATLETIEERGDRAFKVLRPNPKFVDVVTRLGWRLYKRPPEMDDCYRLEVAGAAEYNTAYIDIDQTFHDVELYPPGLVAQLQRLEAEALASLEALRQADVDGTAIKARMAWIRFKNAQKAGKVDRKKGKRSFSPKAMGRETEPFTDIWTYQYRGPFVVFIEKPFNADLSQQTVDETLSLLGQLHDWFEQNLVQPWELKRVKPAENAELAEREGWPLEVVFFAGQESFDRYLEDTMGQTIPGAQTYYAPIEERLVARLPADEDADIRDYLQATLVHETFHFLSDLYAVGPQFSMDEMQTRPRYSSLLVQEGLADMFASLKKEGGGADAQYSFGEVNILRLNDFKTVYELLGNKVLFGLRDLPECRHYGQCNQRATERVKTENLKFNPQWVQTIATSVYCSTACQAAYFFHHFKKDDKYVYRDKWWAFLKDEYQGKHILKSYDDNAGIDAFKAAFEIEADADWDTIEAEFLEFTLALKAPDED